MSSEISPELVDRMVALVRDLHADHVKHGAHDYVQDFVNRTAGIVAELPVDPDLIEARQIAADAIFPVPPTRFVSDANVDLRNAILAGKRDEEPAAVGAILKAIKRGRELALRTAAPRVGEE